eukprot:scaffold47_cov258-Pinguiococcus_pyrenoidosus.AAC.109
MASDRTAAGAAFASSAAAVMRSLTTRPTWTSTSEPSPRTRGLWSRRATRCEKPPGRRRSASEAQRS